jgi:AraC-like DNA-binding protein
MMLTVSTTSGRALLQECKNRGVDVERLLKDVGVNPKVMEDADSRITPDQMDQIWREAHLRTGDEFLALKVALALSPRTYSILHYLAAASGNVREGLESVCRYFDLINPCVELKLYAEDSPPRLVLRHRISPKYLSRNYVEYVFAALISVFRDTAGLQWKPQEVHFTHPSPADTLPVREAFGSELRYDSGVNEMILRGAELNLPQVGSDPDLHGILTQYAKDRLEKLPRGVGLVQEVRTILSSVLSGGEPNLKHTAKKMGMSPRTLQRRLKEEGVFFQDILDQYRFELAVQMLKRQNLPVSDVSFLLGFSEPSSFYKAFKRWTGKAPEAYRPA